MSDGGESPLLGCSQGKSSCLWPEVDNWTEGQVRRLMAVRVWTRWDEK